MIAAWIYKPSSIDATWHHPRIDTSIDIGVCRAWYGANRGRTGIAGDLEIDVNGKETQLANLIESRSMIGEA